MNKVKRFFLILIIGIILLVPSFSFGDNNPISNELTDEELTDIEKMLNEYENNGFLKSVYSRPSKINLNAVLHSYFVKKGEIDVDTLSKEEVENVKKQFNVEEFEIPLFKITTSELLEYYKEKTGEDLKDAKNRLTDYTYIEEYDAYYNMHGDTNYNEVECIEGIKNPEGTIQIQYKGKKFSTQSIWKENQLIEQELMIVTLKKTANGYVFVSNVESNEKKIETKDSKGEEENTKTKLDNVKQVDNTVTKTILPKTGKTNSFYIVGSFIMILIVASFLFFKKKNI